MSPQACHQCMGSRSSTSSPQRNWLLAGGQWEVCFSHDSGYLSTRCGGTTRSMVQHHGNSQAALLHLIELDRETLFLVRVHCCREAGKAAQNSLCWHQEQEKHGLSSARRAKPKPASSHCKAQLACNLENPLGSSLKASPASVPGETTVTPKKVPSLLANKCPPTHPAPEQKRLFQVLGPMLPPQDQS